MFSKFWIGRQDSVICQYRRSFTYPGYNELSVILMRTLFPGEMKGENIHVFTIFAIRQAKCVSRATVLGTVSVDRMKPSRVSEWRSTKNSSNNVSSRMIFRNIFISFLHNIPITSTIWSACLGNLQRYAIPLKKQLSRKSLSNVCLSQCVTTEFYYTSFHRWKINWESWDWFRSFWSLGDDVFLDLEELLWPRETFLVIFCYRSPMWMSDLETEMLLRAVFAYRTKWRILLHRASQAHEFVVCGEDQISSFASRRVFL